MAELLLVEDDDSIRVALTRALTARGHAVRSTVTAAEALTLAETAPPDLVLLDLGLPDIDGQQMLRMLRSVRAVPVIVTTARDDDRAVVAALDAGADDYVVKPFTAAQLDARVRAVLRRTAGAEPEQPLRVGGLRIDLAAHTVAVDGVDADLTPKEFDLLAYLVERPGRVISKRELLNEVWHQPYTGTDKTVDVHLSWLRRKLGESGLQPRYIHTVRGAGVRLTDPEAEDADGCSSR